MDKRIESLIDKRTSAAEVLEAFESLSDVVVQTEQHVSFLEKLRRQIASYDMLIGCLIEIQGPPIFDD